MDENENKTEEQQGPTPHFRIDLNEFWLGEDKLDKELQYRITQKVVRQVMEKISDAVDKEIKEQVTQKIQNTLGERIEGIIAAATKDLKLKYRYQNEEQTLEEFVHKLLTDTDQRSTVNEKIKKVLNDIASDHYEKLKDRFDMLYASQLVSRMKEGGLLNEQVANTLLSPKPEEGD